jgi:hypothetical protein
MGETEQLFNEIVLQKRGEIMRPLLRSVQDVQRLEKALMATVACRQAALSANDIGVYAKQLSLLDGEKYMQADVDHALYAISIAPRGEFETAFPSLGELLERIEAERKRRTRAAAEAAAEDRIEASVRYADKLRLQREDEWNKRKASRIAAEKAARIAAELTKCSTWAEGSD